MADERTKTEPPTALPLRAERSASPPSPLRAADVARPTRDLHAVVRPSGLSSPEGKKLIVGREIELSGNISACDKLIVEGKVEANIKDCREMEITGSGMFKGEAEISIAEISGIFEGTLTAKEILLVRSSGRIRGTVRFGKLEIERGGEIVGDVGTYRPDTD